MILSEQLPAHQLIAAVIPCYNAKGDSTIIITTEGTRLTTGVRLRTIIRHLAAMQATDLSALKKRIARVTEQTILQPLPLTPHLLLFPVKIRKPRIAGDTSTGYINLYAVTGIDHHQESGAIISLDGGAKIASLWTVATVKKHMQFARLAIARTSLATTGVIRENDACYVAGLTPIAQKLVEIICEILLLKAALPSPHGHQDAKEHISQP